MTSTKIFPIMRNLTNSSSSNVDGIQIRPVKLVHILAPILLLMQNSCLDTSVFSTEMQITKVVVLYENGDADE